MQTVHGLVTAADQRSENVFGTHERLECGFGIEGCTICLEVRCELLQGGVPYVPVRQGRLAEQVMFLSSHVVLHHLEDPRPV